MPNWCVNKLDVTGAETELNKFKKASTIAESDALSFNCLVPAPDGLLDGTAKGIDWRDWTDTNWGTKWDVAAEDCNYIRHFEDGTPTDVWEFCTAWAPPTNWLQKASAAFPCLTFRLWYDEPGNGFSGCDVVEGGELQNESWESTECAVFTECAVSQCEEYIDGPDAFMRHKLEGHKAPKAYCEDHALVHLVEMAESGQIKD